MGIYTYDDLPSDPECRETILSDVAKSEDVNGKRSLLSAGWELVPIIFVYTREGAGGWVARQSSIEILGFGASDKASPNWIFSDSSGASEGLTTQLPSGYFSKDFFFAILGIGVQIVGSPVAVSLSDTKVDLSAAATINGTKVPAPLMPREDCKALTADFWNVATQAAYLEFKEEGRKNGCVVASPDQCTAGTGLFNATAANGVPAVSNIKRCRRPCIHPPANIGGRSSRYYLKNTIPGAVGADPKCRTPDEGDVAALLVRFYFHGYLSNSCGAAIANKTEHFYQEMQAGYFT